jgi:hypothetical protein
LQLFLNLQNFVCGDVKLRIQYSPMSKSAEGKLIVTGRINSNFNINWFIVVEARNLAVKDANGFSDVRLTSRKLIFLALRETLLWKIKKENRNYEENTKSSL